MIKEYLIQNTTREQREKIVHDSLSCGQQSCENCSSCDDFGEINLVKMYQPYIDGEKEIDEINREYQANYLK